MPDTDTSIVILDVETTGLDKARDQIIELSIQRGLKEDSPIKTWRIRPTVPISPDAQKTHGITMEDLRDCAKFSPCADKIRQAFDTADVVVCCVASPQTGLVASDLAKKPWEKRSVPAPPLWIRERNTDGRSGLWPSFAPGEWVF